MSDEQKARRGPRQPCPLWRRAVNAERPALWRAGVGESQYLYMKPDGQVYDVRPEITVRVKGYTCSLPVPRTNWTPA
jgi:hypothetical protein